ncbi:MAG: MBL fold metallo-hydrolase, partial [Pyrinomonadaceae bacterium]|nr:MBL fold metallo-hydrolase [Pyrinomonadaceae bacterium]
MKRWLKRAWVVVLLLMLVLVAAAWWSDSDSAVLSGYRSNENAATLRAGWKGTPVDQHGRFMNDEFPYLPRTSKLLQWQLSENKFEAEKNADTFRPQVLDPTEFFAGERDGFIWLGHASFYIRLKGKGILVDPVFGDPPFINRYTQVPSPLDKITQVDYVLNSHDHRDHTDENTLRQIAEKFPNAKFLAGLGSEDIL